VKVNRHLVILYAITLLSYTPIYVAYIGCWPSGLKQPVTEGYVGTVSGDIDSRRFVY